MMKKIIIKNRNVDKILLFGKSIYTISKVGVFLFFYFFISINIVLGQSVNILLNQVGYYPKSTKIALVRWTDAEQFKVVKLPEGNEVFEGSLGQYNYYSDAGDSIKIADFTELTEEGQYCLVVGDNWKSLPFKISKNAYREVAYASLRTFYYQRSSYELLPEYAGLWSRKAGHPDTLVYFHSSTGRTGSAPSPKGWYDAGDYNKYVVNAGISVGNLLQFYELSSDYFVDSTLSIPESGNKINDLLDEVRFELDWLTTMQDTDGGVFHKVTAANFCGFIMPEADKDKRYFVGKGTAATLDFAAMMALSARLYKQYDTIFADSCLKMAKKAWNWAIKNPSIPFSNPPDISTGGYGDKTFSDEFIWAAAELYITTSDSVYYNYLFSKKSSLTSYNVAGWPNVSALGIQSLATVNNNFDTTIIKNIRTAIINKCLSLKNEILSNPARIPNIGYYWGCNGAYAQAGITMIYGFILTKDTSYLLAAGEIADYLLGKNATGYSFFTYYGAKPIMDPHHRPSYSDKITMPIPGFLSGGPNPGRQDGAYYAYLVPAKSFVDVMDSYASNEVAINWNSPATVLLAALDYYLGDKNDYIYYPINSPINSPPVLTLSAPGFGAKIKSTDSVRIKYTVNDLEDKVIKVELYLDSRYICSLSSGNQEFKIPPLSLGEHVISICAYDSSGYVKEKNTRFSIIESSNIIENDNNSERLKVFPNPAKEKIVIQYCLPFSGDCIIRINTIDSKRINEFKKNIEINKINEIILGYKDFSTNQTYIVSLFGNGKFIESKKILINK